MPLTQEQFTQLKAQLQAQKAGGSSGIPQDKFQELKTQLRAQKEAQQNPQLENASQGRLFRGALDTVEQKAKDTYGENSLAYKATLPARAVVRTGAGIADFFSGATQKFGRTAGEALAAPEAMKLYDEALQQHNKIGYDLQKTIDAKKKLGQDTTKLENVLRQYSSATPKQEDFLTTGANRMVNETFGQNLREVGGQALGTVIEATGVGALKGVKGVGLIPAVKEVAQGGKFLPSLGKAVATTLPYGYAAGVSRQLQDKNISNVGAFSPFNLETGISAVLPLPIAGFSKLGGIAKNLINPSEEAITRAQNKITQAYEKTLNLTPTQKQKELNKLKYQGENVFTTPVKEGIDLGTKKAPEQIQTALNKYETVINEAKQHESGYFNINEIIQNAEKNIDERISSATGRKTAKAKVIQEINDVLTEGNNKVITNNKGEALGDINLVERLRKIGNDWTPFNASDPERIGASTGFSLADAVRNQVEKEGTFPSYRQAMRDWGQVIHLSDTIGGLENANKKTFRVLGGLSGKVARRTLSGALGYHTGGLGGLVAAELGSELTADVLANPSVRTYIDRKILENSGRKVTKESASKLAQEIKDYVKEIENRPRLESPSTIYQKPTQMGQEFTPNQTGFKTSPIVETRGLKEGEIPYSKIQKQATATKIPIKNGISDTIAQPAKKSKFSKLFIDEQTPIENAIKKVKATPNKQGGFATGIGYKGEKDLTTKILKDLEGKTTVSKQYILDATNRGELKQVERDLIRDVLNRMDNNVDPLIQEAKKYKSADDFSKRIQGSATQYGDYFPNLRHYGMGDYKNISELGVAPEKMVTIYRGIDDTTGKIPKKINDGDFVTTDYDSAYSYAGDNVVSMEVPAKTLYTDGIDDFKNEPFFTGAEYVYTKKKIQPKTESELKDIWNKANKGEINVADFAKKVKAELLPLEIKTPEDFNPRLTKDGSNYHPKGGGTPLHENTVLDNEIRGKVKNYTEHVYESPIETSAGRTHFSYASNEPQNYFGHTRIEDMADNKTRRVIEVQSDLYQKGNLEKEIDTYKKGDKIRTKNGTFTVDYVGKDDGGLFYRTNDNGVEEYIRESQIVNGKKQANILQQYNDPTAHFRMIREEIKKASQDGKTKLQFPTGETAMKIEGLGENVNFYDTQSFNQAREMSVGHTQGMNFTIKPEQLEVGKEITQRGGDSWIITDVLGDGKFKAVPKDKWDSIEGSNRHKLLESSRSFSETFDISGKVDTNNPIYKFYEKDVQKYLQKFGGKRVVDNKGVSWIEVPITKEQGKSPVEAFGKVNLGVVGTGAILGAGAVGAEALSKTKQPETKPKVTKEQDVSDIKLNKIPSTDEIKRQISFRETGIVKGDKYKYEHLNKNGTKDYGKYGINEDTLETYGKKFLGRDVNPEEFKNSPELQEKFLEKEIEHLKKLGVKKYDSLLVLHHLGFSNILTKKINEKKASAEGRTYMNNKPK